MIEGAAHNVWYGHHAAFMAAIDVWTAATSADVPAPTLAA